MFFVLTFPQFFLNTVQNTKYMNNLEIWKDIPEYESYYQVSNFGNIKSLKFGKERVLKAGITKQGYSIVNLSKNKKQISVSVHRIVAIAFLGHNSKNRKIIIDHINNIKTDNRLENLQIITQRQNTSKDKKIGSSKYTGVSWDKRKKKWRVMIQINSNNIFLGLFTDEYEAHLAYEKALSEIKN